MGDRFNAARAIATGDRNLFPLSHDALEVFEALDLSDPSVRALPIRTLAVLLGAATLRIAEAP